MSEDRPPAASFTGPAQNARLNPRAANVLAATATDDRAVARVVFVDDGRVVCEDAAAPFTCPYAPEGRDVGSNTLSAAAVDSIGQTATAFRVVRLDRFGPRRVTARTTPSTDGAFPFRFTATGRVVRPRLGPAALLALAPALLAERLLLGRLALGAPCVRLARGTPAQAELRRRCGWGEEPPRRRGAAGGAGRRLAGPGPRLEALVARVAGEVVERHRHSLAAPSGRPAPLRRSAVRGARAAPPQRRRAT